MKKFGEQKKNYCLFIIYFVFSNILIGCMSDIKDNYNNKTNYQKTKIALLLPIGSKNRELSYLGKSLRDATILAKEDLNNNSFEIKIYKTFGKTNEGFVAYRNAVKENNEIVIGPYLSTVTKAISKKFPFDNLKVISLSNDPTIVGTNIFILGDTIVNRANNLIQHAINNNKYRFALINPTKYENSKLEKIIKNNIIKNKGIITFSSYYSKDINKISNTAEYIKQKLIDYKTDVIIFTGDPDKKMSLLAAELADITKSKKELGIQVIVLSNWNDSASIVLEPSLQKSWFTIPDERFRKFYENKFIKKFGYKPHPKSSLAYDAIAALGVLDKELHYRNNNYKTKFSGLFNSNGFIGIDGIFRFNYDRIAEKELSVIQINNGLPKVIKQARNRFP